MSRPPEGDAAAGDDTSPAVCAHTHLFPGARCRLQRLSDPPDFAAAPHPVGLELRFSDGVVADAELLVAAAGEALLSVVAYTTRAGTRIAARAWLVGGFRCVGEEVEVTVGGQAGGPPR